MIAVLLSSRRASPWTEDSINAYLLTRPPEGSELIVCVPADEHWPEHEGVRYARRNHGVGREGLHLNFNLAAAETSAEWLLILCDDMRLLPGWYDEFLAAVHDLDPSLPLCMTPPMVPNATTCHLISRGWVERLKAVSLHWIADTYMNDVAYKSGVWKQLNGAPWVHEVGVGVPITNTPPENPLDPPCPPYEQLPDGSWPWRDLVCVGIDRIKGRA